MRSAESSYRPRLPNGCPRWSCKNAAFHCVRNHAPFPQPFQLHDSGLESMAGQNSGELSGVTAHCWLNGHMFSTFGTERAVAWSTTGLKAGGHDRTTQPAEMRTPRNTRTGVRQNSTAVRRPAGTPRCLLARCREVSTAISILLQVQHFNPNAGQKFVETKFCPSPEQPPKHLNSLFTNAL